MQRERGLGVRVGMADSGENMESGAAFLEAIRLRAYYLWERAGRPNGGDMEFWEEARQQIEREREASTSLASEG